MPDNDPPIQRQERSRRRSSKRKKRKKRIRNLQIITVVVALMLVVGYVTYRIFRPPDVNTAAAITNEDFDPVEQYDVILEKGTADQKLILLKALVDRPQYNVDLPVLTDLNQKISNTASELLKHKSLTDADQEYAARKKLFAIWKLYLLNMQNDVHDPFLCDQYRKTVDEFIKSEHPILAKEAHIGRLQYYAGETITGRNNDVSHVSNAAIKALNAFPNDRDVIEGVQRAHSQLINAKQELALEVAEQITSSQQSNDSPESRELLRYLSDLTLLYELGIGNLPSISDLNTTVDEFYERVRQLAQRPGIGETVYRQLLNSVMYLEKTRHYDKAIELGKLIAKTATSQSDPDIAALGKSIGDDSVKRSMLVKSNWQFSETDFRGNAIDNDGFSDTVSLIVMYRQNAQTTTNFLKMMESLERVFQGKNLRLIYVAVLDSKTDDSNPDLSIGKKNILLVTNLEEPNNFLQQCPTERLPYLILVNKDGMVDSINVPAKALKTRIEALL